MAYLRIGRTLEGAVSQAELDAIASVPSDLVAYRASGVSTPTAWSEYTSTRGRMIVGLPSGGADAGTVGTALTTAQDKSKSIAHTHTTDAHDHVSPSHQHSMWGYHDGDTAYFGDNPFGGTGATFTFVGYHAEHGNMSSSLVGDNTQAKSAGTTTETALTSNAMSANAAVVTSDLLAYIQLMVIKKD